MLYVNYLVIKFIMIYAHRNEFVTTHLLAKPPHDIQTCMRWAQMHVYIWPDWDNGFGKKDCMCNVHAE